MFANAITAVVAALPIFAMAAPTPGPEVPATASPPKQLKTKLISGYSRFDNLYAEHYHTGAGFNDVTFNATKNYAFAGGIDQGNYTVTESTISYTMGLDLTQYTAWNKVELNVGENNNLGGVYYYNSTTGSLWYNSRGTVAEPTRDINNNEFGGWLVCDWSHGVPQLFWRTAGYTTKFPDSCASVSLLPQDP